MTVVRRSSSAPLAVSMNNSNCAPSAMLAIPDTTRCDKVATLRSCMILTRKWACSGVALHDIFDRLPLEVCMRLLFLASWQRLQAYPVPGRAPRVGSTKKLDKQLHLGLQVGW